MPVQVSAIGQWQDLDGDELQPPVRCRPARRGCSYRARARADPTLLLADVYRKLCRLAAAHEFAYGTTSLKVRKECVVQNQADMPQT